MQRLGIQSPKARRAAARQPEPSYESSSCLLLLLDLDAGSLDDPAELHMLGFIERGELLRSHDDGLGGLTQELLSHVRRRESYRDLVRELLHDRVRRSR